MPRSEPHILVVDDEQDICANLQDILTDFGYRVDTAPDAAAALHMLDERVYDIALLDLKMPGISGVELCRKMRDQRCGTVGMILTAYASPQTAQDALRAGAWTVMSKPIDTRQLMDLIEKILRQPLVLVVDDDRDLCQSMHDLLRDQGYRVMLAHSQSEAHQRIDADGPHVALIDLKLADEDGLEVFEQIRSRMPDSRTILITAHRDEMSARIHQALQRGVTSVCYKPFEPTQLLEAIRQSLGENKAS
ncbi:MAG: response regulator [Pirellulales bacterium]